MSWWRISRKWLERGSELSIITFVAICGVSSTTPVGGRVPPDRVADELQEVLRVDPLGFRQEAGLGEQPVQRRRVFLDDRPLAGQLELDGGRVHALEQPEVQEGDAAVVQQQEVARVGVAGELVVAVQAAEEEAEHDLAEPVALGLRALLQLLEADAARRTR